MKCINRVVFIVELWKINCVCLTFKGFVMFEREWQPKVIDQLYDSIKDLLLTGSR